jgi:hypothetical protein
MLSPMLRRLLPLSLLLVTGCPTGQMVRSYPEPKPDEVVAHLRSLPERASSLKAETLTDFRLGKDRVNLTVWMLAAWGGKLRFQAQDPNGATAADLASDGRRYCFLDVHDNCAECGPATPENVARMIRIPLEPDQVVAVLLGAVPLIGDDPARARVAWDAAEGHEVVTIEGDSEIERIVLDGKDRRWDVLEAETRSVDGKMRWRLRHKDFHEVKSEDGHAVRLPGASLFEQAGDTVRISWKQQVVGEKQDAGKFQMTPPPGLPTCAQKPSHEPK